MEYVESRPLRAVPTLNKEAIDDSGGTSSPFRPVPVACSTACDEKEVKQEFQLSVVGLIGCIYLRPNGTFVLDLSEELLFLIFMSRKDVSV